MSGIEITCLNLVMAPSDRRPDHNMQSSLSPIGAVSSSDSDIETTSLRLHLAPLLPSLPSCEPSKYTTEIWQSLRPYLEFCGYRLVTQRDMAFEMAEATGKPIPDHWNGPPNIDDELYSASSVRCSLPPCFFFFFMLMEFLLRQVLYLTATACQILSGSHSKFSTYRTAAKWTSYLTCDYQTPLLREILETRRYQYWKY